MLETLQTCICCALLTTKHHGCAIYAYKGAFYIAKSCKPRLHNSWIDSRGIDCSYSCKILAVPLQKIAFSIEKANSQGLECTGTGIIGRTSSQCKDNGTGSTVKCIKNQLTSAKARCPERISLSFGKQCQPRCFRHLDKSRSIWQNAITSFCGSSQWILDDSLSELPPPPHAVTTASAVPSPPSATLNPTNALPGSIRRASFSASNAAFLELSDPLKESIAQTIFISVLRFLYHRNIRERSRRYEGSPYHCHCMDSHPC